MNKPAGNVDVANIEVAIRMLNTHVNEERIKPFIAILEALKQAPDNEALLVQLQDAFQDLGMYQGAVLTYAASIYELMVVDPFND
jgi:hypothetical protein